MKAFLSISAAFLVLLALVSCNTAPGTNGEQFEDLKVDQTVTESTKVQQVLLNTNSKADADYLGLKGLGEFRIDDIKAKAVIIYVMSSSCPTCLESVEGMIDLKNEIDKRKADIKIIVIATGDSEKIAADFKEKTTFEFPVFPDQDGQLSKVLEVDEVPHLIAVVRDENNAYNIIFDHNLVMDDPAGFLDFLLRNM